MPRVLLVTYHFPPEPAAGARRPELLARHLPEFGWNVTVLTRPCAQRSERPLSSSIVEAPVWGQSLENSLRASLSDPNEKHSAPSPLRRFLRWARRALYFPDPAVGWLVPCVARGIALHRERRFDAVLSTAMPITAHLAGAAIAAAAKLPWIADYRDPWTGNHMKASTGTRAAIERFLERAALRNARTITAVPTIRTRIEALHRRAVVPIANAYDPDDWNGLESIQPDSFTLCHTGNLYDGLVSPELLFTALAALRAKGHPAAGARVVFCGANGGHVRDSARRWGVEDLIEERGVLAHREVLELQRRSSDLLVFLKMDESAAHVLGSKVIEYCGSRRPILGFGPRASAMRAFLTDNALGWFASDGDQAERAVVSAYERFAAGDRQLAIAPGIVSQARGMASAFAAQLSSLTPKGSSTGSIPPHDSSQPLQVR